jgi:hypothetical protein
MEKGLPERGLTYYHDVMKPKKIAAMDPLVYHEGRIDGLYRGIGAE